MMSELTRDIKQSKPFPSLEQEVYLNLQRSAYLARLEILSVLEPFDLSDVQYNVLRILRGAGEDGLPIKDVGERLIIRDSDATKWLEPLRDRCLLKRENGTHDGRIKIVKITPEGLAILKNLDEPMLNRSKVVLGHVGKEDLEQFNALLVLARKRTGVS